MISNGIAVGLVVFAAPILLVAVIAILQYPLASFFILYVATFGILGVARYVELPFPPGLIIDILLVFNFVILLIYHLWGHVKIGTVYLTPVLVMSILWMLYCLLELLNPMSTFSNWTTTVRNIGIHIVAFQILVFMLLNDLNRLNLFFKVWGILVIAATLKAIGQKYIGFDAAEQYWLNTAGGSTHIIYSGIRYFSFYTDAANYGCNMGLSIVIFTILSLQEKNRLRRIFYIIIILCSIYGFMISGTRAAMAVPFVGFATWVFLVKEWKWIIIGAGFLALIFVFFTFTDIGQSNASIRRMRTTFEFTEDASFNVRLENQKKMRAFMSEYPFGIGMGNAKNTKPGDLMYGIATDSSLVFIWIETGIVGLVFYLLIFFMVIGYGTYYTWIVLKDQRVKTITIAATAGVAGMLVAGYANEVLHQLPAGPTIYLLIGIIMMSPYLDKELRNEQKSL